MFSSCLAAGLGPIGTGGGTRCCGGCSATCRSGTLPLNAGPNCAGSPVVARWISGGHAASSSAHDGRMEGSHYRSFVTRGDPYIEENFDICAGSWRQGESGQPLASLVLGNAETDAGLVP